MNFRLSLMRFPSEVRRRIFRFTAVQWEPISIPCRSLRITTDRWHRENVLAALEWYKSPSGREASTKLFRVNKAISEEALEEFYKGNTFRFFTTARQSLIPYRESGALVDTWVIAESWLHTIGPKNRSYLRHIILPKPHLTKYVSFEGEWAEAFDRRCGELGLVPVPMIQGPRTFGAIVSILSSLPQSLKTLKIEVRTPYDLFTPEEDLNRVKGGTPEAVKKKNKLLISHFREFSKTHPDTSRDVRYVRLWHKKIPAEEKEAIIERASTAAEMVEFQVIVK